jgi:division protein CdvB (Snf7/Vps24/ESCRT-III family)
VSRIYTVRAKAGHIVRYVRANTLNAAVRAVAEEMYVAKASTTDEVYQAMLKNADVLDAVAPEQSDIDELTDEFDPGPAPVEAA